jgi:glycosyltransferase involved in cell wall biosynthesis
MFPRLSETFILNEILELEKQGVPLQIFSLKRPADSVSHSQAKLVRSPISYIPEKIHLAPGRVARGIAHVALKYHRNCWHLFHNLMRRFRKDRDPSSFRSFCQACCVIREMREIHHLHAHYANIPAKLAMTVQRLTGASYSITTHAKDIFQNDPFESAKLQERMCRARFVVANSRFAAAHILTGLNGQGNIHTVYNGLNLEDFPLRRKLPTEPLILSVGRLVEKKGFNVLIDACRILKERRVNFTCELVGTGRLSDAIKDQIRQSGTGAFIKLIGPLPQETLRRHYERASVFTLPCVVAADGDRDILPNVIKEAMAIGVPVVTTCLDGIEELVEHGVSGWLVPPDDAVALADALERILASPHLAESLAVQARKSVTQRFDRQSNIARLKGLLLDASEALPVEAAAETMPGERILT